MHMRGPYRNIILIRHSRQRTTHPTSSMLSCKKVSKDINRRRQNRRNATTAPDGGVDYCPKRRVFRRRMNVFRGMLRSHRTDGRRSTLWSRIERQTALTDYGWTTDCPLCPVRLSRVGVAPVAEDTPVSLRTATPGDLFNGFLTLLKSLRSVTTGTMSNTMIVSAEALTRVSQCVCNASCCRVSI